jgi:hypothetical protein
MPVAAVPRPAAIAGLRSSERGLPTRQEDCGYLYAAACGPRNNRLGLRGRDLRKVAQQQTEQAKSREQDAGAFRNGGGLRRQVVRSTRPRLRLPLLPI